MLNLVAYDFDWSIVTENRTELLKGLGVMLQVTFFAFLIALSLGLIIAGARMSHSPVLSVPASIYIWLMRAVPLLVLIFWIYYGLPGAIDVTLGAFVAGAVSLGLTGSAYMAEIYRGGLQSIDVGQREAGLAVGLSRGHTFRSILLPQVVRRILPTTVNLFVGLLKGATLLGIIGVSDLLYFAQVEALRTFKPFELYTAAGLMLATVTLCMAGLASLLDRWLAKGQDR